MAKVWSVNSGKESILPCYIAQADFECFYRNQQPLFSLDQLLP